MKKVFWLLMFAATVFISACGGGGDTTGGTGSGIVGTWTGSTTTPQQISYTVTFNSDGAFAKISTMNIGGVAYSCSSTGTYTVSGNLVAIPYESGSCAAGTGGSATFTESNGIRTVTSAVGAVSTSTVDSSLTISGTNLIANANTSLVFTRGGTTGGTTTTGAPTVTSFSPSTAQVGSSITITGTNFSTTPTSNTVKFNGTTATVTAATATLLTVTVPSGAATGAITVTTSGGTAASAGSFTVGAGGGGIPTAPSGVTATAGNNKLTISWSSVTGATSYNIYRSTTSGVTKSSAKVALNVTGASYSDTTAANGITYYYAMTAVNSSGESALSNEVSAKPSATTTSVPTITSFTPTSGAVGTTVTITGTNFSTTPANNTVKFNGTAATVTAATATSLTVTVPSGATSGTVSVTTAGGTATSAGSFTGSPTVTGLSSTGTTVTITGTNFSTTPTNNTVIYNGIQATITVSTATSLAFMVPSGTTISTVSVATSGGNTTSSDSYTTGSTIAYPKPSFNFTSLTFAPQDVGTTSQAQTVTLTNTGNAVLQFNYWKHFDWLADWHITTTCTDAQGAAPTQGGFYVLAAGASCTFSVTVTPKSDDSLTGPYYLSTSLGYTPNPIPPQPIGGYLEVVNVGNGGLFPWGVDTSRAKVIFNGTAVYNLTPICTSPQVLQNGVCVTPTPTVTGMSPSTGAVGATVTITGTNFSTTPANNTVKFNGTAATVTAASATSLTVTVPGGAITGPVSVTTAGGAATSAGSFTITTTSTGTLSGYVKDAVTNTGLSGITVNIYSGSSLVASLATDSSGIYTTTTLAVGTYSLNITNPGYITANINNVSIQANVTTTVETVLQVSTAYSGTGTISGTVKDAFTGLGISGVTLNFRSGINATTGTILATTTTGTNGIYTVSTLTSGNYTAEAIKSGYTTGYFSVASIGGQTKSNQEGTITPVLTSGETRIVLAWGTTPSDLDSHLTGPISGSTSRFHVYYSAKGSSTSSPYAKLDVDDTSSYGPETTTIYQQATGTYRFSVHDWSNKSSASSTALSSSAAQVKVYGGSGLVATFNVPVSQGGTLWTVFELNGNTITPINTMSYVSSSSSVQAPALHESQSTVYKSDVPLIRNLPDKMY